MKFERDADLRTRAFSAIPDRTSSIAVIQQAEDRQKADRKSQRDAHFPERENHSLRNSLDLELKSKPGSSI
jgi:hypothetical protein